MLRVLPIGRQSQLALVGRELMGLPTKVGQNGISHLTLGRIPSEVCAEVRDVLSRCSTEEIMTSDPAADNINERGVRFYGDLYFNRSLAYKGALNFRAVYSGTEDVLSQPEFHTDLLRDKIIRPIMPYLFLPNDDWGLLQGVSARFLRYTFKDGVVDVPPHDHLDIDFDLSATIVVGKDNVSEGGELFLASNERGIDVLNLGEGECALWKEQDTLHAVRHVRDGVRTVIVLGITFTHEGKKLFNNTENAYLCLRNLGLDHLSQKMTDRMVAM